MTEVEAGAKEVVRLVKKHDEAGRRYKACYDRRRKITQPGPVGRYKSRFTPEEAVEIRRLSQLEVEHLKSLDEIALELSKHIPIGYVVVVGDKTVVLSEKSDEIGVHAMIGSA